MTEAPDSRRRVLPFRAGALLARAVGAASRALGRGSGSVVGGQVLLRLEPDAVRRLAAGRTCVLVSGSNGKTTTSRFLTDALRCAGPVAHNATGSNMTTGIATALLGDRSPTAVLEVDEHFLAATLDATGARVVVLTNLSRDQLDRYGGVADLVTGWRRALEAAPPGTVAVTTCDDPLAVYAAMAAPRAVWVATPYRWILDSTLCPSCSHLIARDDDRWWCPDCGLARPEPDWQVDGSHLLDPHGGRWPLALELPGRANRGNAALAAAAANELGVLPSVTLGAAATVAGVEGRFATLRIGAHEVRLLLAKNPASWAEVLDLVADADRPLVMASNGRAADGRDLSWLYDVDFEALAGRAVTVFGERRLDLAVRLQTAGVRPELVTDLDDGLAALAPGPVDVVASYTALQDLLADPRWSAQVRR